MPPPLVDHMGSRFVGDSGKNRDSPIEGAPATRDHSLLRSPHPMRESSAASPLLPRQDTPSGFVVQPRLDSFLPFSAPPSTLGLVTQVRSTLIATSIQSLRTRGLLARYTKLLQGPHKETVLTAVAGSWLPVEVAHAHYAACEALHLDSAQQLAMGMDVGDRVNGTFLGLMVRTAKTVGVTPWIALAQSAKLHSRLFEGGGGLSIIELGPKEARVDMVGHTLCNTDYFRNGTRGVYQAATRLFCSRVYTHELSRRAILNGMSIRISWV